MKVYFVFSRTYALILLIVLLICSLLLAVAAQSKASVTLETENQRNSYISSNGYSDAKLILAKEVFVPLTFNDNLKTYNEKVKIGGYDLSLYGGRYVKLYSYRADKKTIHLFTYCGKLICTDISENFNDITYF